MTPLASAIAAATATLKQVNGVAVTLASGTSSASVTAIVGSSTFPMEDADGFVTNVHTRDYLILASDFAATGLGSEPPKGLQITETVNGVNYTYRAQSPDGEQPWRWSDPHRIKFRIHTKLSGTATAGS